MDDRRHSTRAFCDRGTLQRRRQSPSRRIASCSSSRPPRRTSMTSRRCPFDHLAHRGTAEHQNSTPRNQVRGIDAQMPAHRAAIKQDGLLRQPFAAPPSRHLDPRAHTRCALAGRRGRTAPPPARQSWRAPPRPTAIALSSTSPPATPPEVFSVTKCTTRHHPVAETAPSGTPPGAIRPAPCFATLFQRSRMLADARSTDRFGAERDIVHRSAANAATHVAYSFQRFVDRPFRPSPKRSALSTLSCRGVLAHRALPG